MTSSISFQWSVCSVGLFLLDSVLASCKILENCPFLPDCQTCCHTVVHSILLWFFYFCCIRCDFSFFISNFGYLGSFSPLFSESGQGFVNFVDLFKEPALGFINFLYCFLSLYFIDFFFDLYNFLPSADFRSFFVLLFLVRLGGGLSCQFGIFLLFWGRPVLL